MEASDVTDDSMKVFRVPEQLAEGQQEAENANEGNSSTTIMGNLVSNTSEESVEGSSVSPGEISGGKSAVLEKMEEGRKDEKVETRDDEKVVGGNLPGAIVAVETTADVASSNVCAGGGEGKAKASDFVSVELKTRGTSGATESANDCEDVVATQEKTEVIEDATKKEENPVGFAAEETKIDDFKEVVSLEAESGKNSAASDAAVVPTSLEIESGNNSSASDAAVVPTTLEAESGKNSAASDAAALPISLETEPGNNSSASDAAVVPTTLETESGKNSAASDAAALPISLETEPGNNSSASDDAVVPTGLETESGKTSSASDAAALPISSETESGKNSSDAVVLLISLEEPRNNSSASDAAVLPISLEPESGKNSSASDAAVLPISLEIESGNHSSASDTALPPVVVVSSETIKPAESSAESVELTTEVKGSVGHELKETQSNPEENPSETVVNEAEKSESKSEEQSTETVETLIKAAESKPQEHQQSEAAGTIALVDLQTSEKENFHSEEATTNELKVSQSSSEAAAVVSEEMKATPVSSLLADSSQDVKVEAQQDVSKEKYSAVPPVTSTEIAEDIKSKEGSQDNNPSSLEVAAAVSPDNVDLIDLSIIIEPKVEPSNSISPDVVPFCEATVQNVEDTPVTTEKVSSETTASSDGLQGTIAPTNSPVLTVASEIISPPVAELSSTIPDIITPAEETAPSVVESIAATTPVATTSEVKSEETSAASVISPTDVTIPSDETTPNKEAENEIKSDVSGAACTEPESKETTEKPANKLGIQNLTLRSLDEMWRIVPKGYGSLAPEVKHKRKSAQPSKPRETRSAAASSSSEAELREDNQPRRKRKSEKEEALSTKLEKSVAEEVEPIDFSTNPTGPKASCPSAGVSAPELKPSCSTAGGASAPELKPPSALISKPEELEEMSKTTKRQASGPTQLIPSAPEEKPVDVLSSTSQVAMEIVIDDPNKLSLRYTKTDHGEDKRQKKRKSVKRKQSGRENDRPQEARRDEMEQQQQPLSGPFKSFVPQSFQSYMAIPNVSVCGSPNVPMKMIPQMVRNSPSSSDGTLGGTDRDYGQWGQNPSRQPAQHNSRERADRGGQLRCIQPEQVPFPARSQSVGQRSRDSAGGEKRKGHYRLDKYVQVRLYRCPNRSCKREWRIVSADWKRLLCKECQTYVNPYKTKGKSGDEARSFFQCPDPDCKSEWSKRWIIGKPSYCRHAGCENDLPVFAYREKPLY